MDEIKEIMENARHKRWMYEIHVRKIEKMIENRSMCNDTRKSLLDFLEGEYTLLDMLQKTTLRQIIQLEQNQEKKGEKYGRRDKALAF